MREGGGRGGKQAKEREGWLRTREDVSQKQEKKENHARRRLVLNVAGGKDIMEPERWRGRRSNYAY